MQHDQTKRHVTSRIFLILKDKYRFCSSQYYLFAVYKKHERNLLIFGKKTCCYKMFKIMNLRQSFVSISEICTKNVCVIMRDW